MAFAAAASDTVESRPPERIATPFMPRIIGRGAPKGYPGIMRCFVAMEVPEEVRAFIVRVQEALRRAGADVKWVERENLHLTLKFLGDLEEDAAARLGGALAAETARWPRLRLSFGGIGVFPER